MKAFHNNEKIKQTYLSRVIAHQRADEIVKGKYWEGGKGCAVGCTIHSDDHSKYETELGIPQWLARLEDRIFEGLPNERAKKWPREFLEAITPGQNLELIKIPMLIFIVECARGNFNHEKYPEQLKAIDGVLTELRRDPIDLGKLREARYAASAYSAANAAAYAAANAAASAAAYAAAYAYAAASADAAYAAAYADAYAAASAAASADAAAYADAAANAAAYAAANAYAAAAATAASAASADAAAYAADAREKTYVKFADKLLALINQGNAGET